MTEKQTPKTLSALWALLLAAALIPGALAASHSGRILVDGYADDWDQAGVETVAIPDFQGGEGTSSWRAAKGADGTVYLCFQGETSQAYPPFYGMSIQQAGSYNSYISPDALRQIPGLQEAGRSESNNWQLGPFVLEFSIPADYFTDPNFVLSFNGTSIPADSMPVLDDVPPTPSQPPVYQGIVIDGSFQDWAAVQKSSIQDPGGRTSEMALVFDGDLYIYIYEISGSATTSGTHNNGVFCIATDLGYQLKLQLKQDETVDGVEGAQARHVGRQWELRIPREQLPPFRSSLSIGFEMADPQITDVADLSGKPGSAGQFSGIVIDGQYGDWLPFPHTSVGYGGEDKGANYVALYLEDATLYGHVSTTVERILAEKGSSLLGNITITFEGIDGGVITLQPRLPDSLALAKAPLEDGLHTFVLPYPGDDATLCGTMMLTINGVKDETEFDLDLVKIAEKLGVEPNDLKDIKVHINGLGGQSVSLGGASTAPWLLLCLLVPGAFYMGGRYHKRREEEK